MGQGGSTKRHHWANRWGVALTALGLASAAIVPCAAAGAVRSGSGSSEIAQARRALLVLSDMPSGWKSTKAPNNTNSTAGDTQLAHCIGVAASLISENPPSVDSPQFQSRSGSLTVNDNVTVFPSARNALAELGTAANKKTPGCMTALAQGPLKKQLFGNPPKGVTYGIPLVSATDPTAFPFTAGYSISWPAVTHGETVNITVTQLFAAKGRLGQQIVFTSFGAPFAIATEQRIATTAVERL
ncbi:MAG TPA: hypothetical protein VMP41_00700 [Acidimicrobiales bacterium]|nr:hypothetical protein [Acidimicrobiales bacterium]